MQGGTINTFAENIPDITAGSIQVRLDKNDNAGYAPVQEGLNITNGRLRLQLLKNRSGAKVCV